MSDLEQMLTALRAVAEPTRLRLLALGAQGELSVSELTRILGQSQPRVSRHLKLMVDAGLLERFREGSWVFYRLATGGPGRALAARIEALLPADDPQLALDRRRLEDIRAARAESAIAYFSANAARWDSIRSLHVDDVEVERVLLAHLGDPPPERVLDVGTGTARMLELFGPLADEAVGVDGSRDMLRVARTNLERAGLGNCRVRHGDIYHLPVGPDRFDLVLFHQVLHYAEDPAAALREAARVVTPGGRLTVIDFAPHELESLRTEHSHRRLGFADHEVTGWMRDSGLEPEHSVRLPGEPLTVVVWLARRPAAADRPAASDQQRRIAP